MVACSRFAPGEGSEGSDFPCRHGHGCFRQLDQNLPLEHEANLLDLARLNAQISVFIGCNMLFGHGSWFHGEATLIDRLSRSRVRAAIATIGVATYSPDVEALVLYGLSAGMTLGEVCDLLNGHFASRVSSVGLPRGVGPMFVIGDHRVRVRGLSFAEPSVSQGQRGEIAISCPDASHALGWMRAVSPPRPLAPGQSLEVTSSAPWMWSTYVTASNTVLVWLFDACSAPHTVDIRWSPSRFELERRQLVELDHWTEVCTALAECVRGKGGNAKPFDDVALLHRQLSADLEKVLIQRAAARFEVIIRDVDALVDMEHLVGDLREADQIRVAAVASHVNLIGTRLFHLWQSKWQVTQVDCQTGDRCSCGGALFSSLFEGVLDERRREILSCPSCGPVHEGPAAAGWPASRPLHASLETPVAVAGSLLTWSVRNCASKSAHLALALQDWYRSASITTDAIELAPGECRRISLELPATLHPGAYPAAVVASFGGELSLRRQMCNVSRRPAVLRRLPAD
ncbi:Uncharacterised protein [Xylophilus ampelinus]|nr:Uncharacterised protein [Xylophilus ampelinus]